MHTFDAASGDARGSLQLLSTTGNGPLNPVLPNATTASTGYPRLHALDNGEYLLVRDDATVVYFEAIVDVDARLLELHGVPGTYGSYFHASEVGYDELTINLPVGQLQRYERRVGRLTYTTTADIYVDRLLANAESYDVDAASAQLVGVGRRAFLDPAWVGGGSPIVDYQIWLRAPTVDADVSSAPDGDARTAQGWSLFPNPARDHVRIRRGNAVGADARGSAGQVVRLLDARGRTVREGALDASGDARLGLTGLPGGLYVVCLPDGTRRRIVCAGEPR